MQIKYLINEQPITIGQPINIDGLGPCAVVALFADYLTAKDATGYSYTFYHSELISNGVTVLRLPEVGYFHRFSGVRIESGDETLGGTIEGVYDDVLRFDRNPGEAYHRFVEVDPSVENLGWGVEIRIHPTKDELENGLPRVVRDDGEICVTIDGELVPVADAVWLEGAYRRISDCYLQAGWETRYVLDTTGMIRLNDGRFALENEVAEVTYGPRSGERLYLSEVRPTYEGFIVPVGEVVPFLNEYGQESLRAEINPIWVKFGNFYTESRYLRECERTGVMDHVSRMLRLDTDELVSREWAEENARCCDECGCYYETNDRGSECPRCRRHARTRIRNYSNKSAAYLAPAQDVPLKFGIELEVGCDRGFDRDDCAEVMADAIDSSDTPIEEYAIFKEDGSLSSCNGFEIVTRPDSPAVHKRIWGLALSEPSVSQYMSSYNNGKCGIHIHVSRAPLSHLWIGRLLVLVNSPANRPLIHKIAGRGHNDYTRYYHKKLSDGRGYGVERYEALNTSGDNTIEFRVFRGTLNRDSFLKNIEFVEAALEFTRPASRSVRDMDTPAAFLEFISKSRKTYPHLFQFLVNRALLTK